MIHIWPSMATRICHNMLALPRSKGCILVALVWTVLSSSSTAKLGKITSVQLRMVDTVYFERWHHGFDYTHSHKLPTQSSPPTDHQAVDPGPSCIDGLEQPWAMYDHCPGPWLWLATQLEPTTNCELCRCKERERERYLYIHTCTYVYIYIYI